MITQERLKELLTYIPETGEWQWNHTKGRRVKGGNASFIHTTGYFAVRVDNRRYHSHRLAWLYMTGSWPRSLVDHKNRTKLDNSWSNLREATVGQNRCNAQYKSNLGIKGVFKSRNKYRVLLQEKGKLSSFGSFSSIEEAKEVSRFQQKRIQGDFAFLGKAS